MSWKIVSVVAAGMMALGPPLTAATHSFEAPADTKQCQCFWLSQVNDFAAAARQDCQHSGAVSGDCRGQRGHRLRRALPGGHCKGNREYFVGPRIQAGG